MPSLEYSKSKGLVQKNTDTDSIVLLGQLSGQREHLVDVTDNLTITAADSGKTFMLTDADITISLPTVLPVGISYRFIAKVDLTNPVEIAQLNATEDFQGPIINGAGGVVVQDDAAHTLIRFAANQAKAGDFVECVSTGTVWNVKGSARVAAGIVFA